MNPRRLPIALVPVLVLVLALTLLDAPASFADDAAPSPEPPCGGSVPVGANVAADRPMSPGDYFSYPNRSRAEKRAIRKRVLDTIKSTNGEYCADTGRTDLQGNPVYEVRHGVIKVATWSSPRQANWTSAFCGTQQSSGVLDSRCPIECLDQPVSGD